MTTRHGYRTCKNCGELPIQLFTPELRAKCRACYNSKRRQQNSLGSQQLKQGTWIESTVLSGLYQRVEALEAEIATLTRERSVVDQQLQSEISAHLQLDQEITSLKSQISDLKGLIIQQSQELLNGEEISKQLGTLTQLLPDRSLVDQKIQDRFQSLISNPASFKVRPLFRARSFIRITDQISIPAFTFATPHFLSLTPNLL